MQAQTLDQFASWLASPLGRYLCQSEQDWFDASAADVFGYRALQLGCVPLQGLRSNRIAWQLYAGCEAGVQLFCSGEQLPIDAQSLDLLVMPHGLDFAPDPHAVLREVERVLLPEGRLLLTGFNPWSLWGLRRLQRGGAVPWRGNQIAPGRLRDWLSLLSFEVLHTDFVAHRPPLQREGWLARSRTLEQAGARWWPTSGAVYCLHAVKRVRGMRIIEPQWRRLPAGVRNAAGVGER